jgi:acetyltransferase-like isoleucine patch superfamily enzyme
VGRVYESHLAPLLRGGRTTARAASFRAWTAKLRLELARNGCKLVVDAPSPPTLRRWPRIIVHDAGADDATLRITFGSRVTIWGGTLEVWAEGENALAIGDASVIDSDALIQLQSGSIELADHVRIRSWAVIKSGGELVVCPRVIVSYGCVVHCAESIEIEEMVGLAERVTVIDSDHLVDGSDIHFLDRPIRRSPVRIGRNTFVATNSVVTRGAQLGRNAVVAAGAVVRAGTYPDGTLIAGLPAKPVAELKPDPAGGAVP